MFEVEEEEQRVVNIFNCFVDEEEECFEDDDDEERKRFEKDDAARGRCHRSHCRRRLRSALVVVIVV